MSNRNCRNRNSNELGDIRTMCSRTLAAENDQCRRTYPTADALEDAYNAGYRDGYCAGVENGREQLCEAYEQGARDGCQNTKQDALNCIRGIRC